jgi:penicillin amidase
VLRDRWGVPHIYARSLDDVFYAQGYFAAKDRLFQLDLWRRQGTGRLAEILGPQAIPRDRMARLVRFRGDWDAEWKSYSPDAKRIVEQFVSGINQYIKSLKGQRPVEFQIAGYDPEPWAPEDVVSRIAGLLMTRNVRNEVERVEDIRKFGLERVQTYLPPDPFVQLAIPKGIELALITKELLRDYEAAVATPQFALQSGGPDGEQGSNNWVVDGSMTHTGKPLLANDPHRPILLPSLRKTWHLVGPGLNVFGAGEPALPGIAVGHNESIAWGFTIVGFDQQDLYVEKLNPENPNEYRYRDAWRPVERDQQQINVKGRAQPERVELRYTIHGPIIREDREHHLAYALKWVGAEPGGAGYLPALSLMRAKNWNEFLKAVENYKVPSENLVYADTAGNIGWIAAGAAPVRKNWTGLLPVPGDSGEYEWQGYLPVGEHPQVYNPKRHFVATANHNILPAGYSHQLGFEWALPYRFERIESLLAGRSDLDRVNFERMQQDVLSLPARRFQAIVRRWTPPEGSRGAHIVSEMLAWDAQMRVDSEPALIFEIWISKLGAALFGEALAARVNIETVLRRLESGVNSKALESSLDATLAQVEKALPPNDWQWGRIHQIFFRHPLGVKEWNRGPYARPGGANTVNAASGSNFRQTNGASYRQIIDLSDWDRSEMTNVPGESGDPRSRYYDDLLEEWKYGVYHPMAYSRGFVERNTEERYVLHRAE